MARDADMTIEAPEAITEIDINSIPDFDYIDYDLSDQKQYSKFLTRVEKVCRNSYEYRSLINYLRSFADMDKCSFMKYITNAESREIRIEIHHEPITLYDIVSIITQKRIANGECIDEEMVAKEVMWNHYILHVGLIPLSETVHEMVHNQYLYIPSFAVLGYWREFLEEYKPYVTQDIFDKIDKLDKLSEEYNTNKETEILTPGFVHINVDDPEYKASEEELYNLSKELLDELAKKDQ